MSTQQEIQSDNLLSVPMRCHPDSFSVVHEASLPSGLLQACWCPTMDLVAVVTMDSQLAVHRLNWQRLWSVPCDSPVSALCWRPDGKVLAAGAASGKVVLYDVGTCAIVHTLSPSTAQGQGSPSPVVHLCWTEGPPAPPSNLYSKMFGYRHTRLFSRPASTSQQNQGQRGFPAAAAKTNPLDLTTTDTKDWPTIPKALNMLVSTDGTGRITLHTLGSFHVAHVAADAQLPVPGSQSAQHLDPPRQACMTVMHADLGAMLCVRHSSTALRASLVDTACLASAAQPLVQVSALLTEANDMLQSARSAAVKAGQVWKGAQGELQKVLQSLKQSLEEHQELPPDGGLEAVPGGPDHPDPEQGTVGVRTGDVQDDHVLGELILMLTAGHVSPGVHAWLAGSVGEHGVRRLAQQLDSALQAVTAAMLDVVSPCLEVCVFILKELQGLSDPLLACATAAGAEAHNCAHALGLQSETCLEGVRQGVRALLQCEALTASLVRLGCQYRALFTWLLKTVLQLEVGNAAEQAAQQASAAGAAAAAAATAAAITSLPVDVPSILPLLEGGLFRDTLSPDIGEGFIDPDITPASLSFDPALPTSVLQQLLDCMHGLNVQDPSGDASKDSAAGPGGRAGTSGGGSGRSADVNGGRDQSVGALGAQGAPQETLWPDKPLRKQLAVMDSLMTQLLGQISAHVSPQLQHSQQVTLVQHASQPLSPDQWFVSAISRSDSDNHAATSPQLHACVAVTVRVGDGKHGPSQPQHGVLCCSMQPQPAAQVLLLPAGYGILQVAPYKAGHVTAVVQHTQGNSDDQTQQGSRDNSTAQLMLLPPCDLEPVRDLTLHNSLLEACLSQGAITRLELGAAALDTGDEAVLRCRVLPSLGHKQGSVGGSGGPVQLAVGASRGVALVQCGRSRVQVLDLESDDTVEQGEAESDTAMEEEEDE